MHGARTTAARKLSNPQTLQSVRDAVVLGRLGHGHVRQLPFGRRVLQRKLHSHEDSVTRRDQFTSNVRCMPRRSACVFRLVPRFNEKRCSI